MPSESLIWQNIESKARAIFSQFNYKEIRTPLFEETGLFKRSLGQTSDIVNKQLLELVSSKEEGFALRPEGTASIVRAYLENSIDKQENLSKLFYIGPMFRGERPQKGRLRQFNQIGVEVIGPSAESLFIDAEVIVLSMKLLKEFGLDNCRLAINCLGNEDDKKKLSDYLREKLKDKVTALCEDCQNRFERNVFRILDCKNPSCRAVVDGIKLDSAYLSEESKNRYEAIKNILRENKIDFIESPRLVRGLDYYNEIVFEISNANLGSQDAVGAGGRYNKLAEFIGGESKRDIKGIGFSLGIERIILALDETKKQIESNLGVYIISLGQGEVTRRSFEVLTALRNKGISSDMNFQGNSLKSQMRVANKSNAKLAVIIGEDEIKKEVVVLKDMAQGEQFEISIAGNDFNNLFNKVRERL